MNTLTDSLVNIWRTQESALSNNFERKPHVFFELIQRRYLLGALIVSHYTDPPFCIFPLPLDTVPFRLSSYATSSMCPHRLVMLYFEQQIQWELKGIRICGCQWNERLKAKTDGSTRLGYTGFRGELGHVKIETRRVFLLFIMNQ